MNFNQLFRQYKAKVMEVLMHNKRQFDELVYWCPEQLIQTLKGVPLEPVPTLFAHGATLWFVVYKDGTGGMISGMDWYAIMYRALMNGQIENINVKPDPKPEEFTLIKKVMLETEGITDEMVKNAKV